MKMCKKGVVEVWQWIWHEYEKEYASIKINLWAYKNYFYISNQYSLVVSVRGFCGLESLLCLLACCIGTSFFINIFLTFGQNLQCYDTCISECSSVCWLQCSFLIEHANSDVIVEKSDTKLWGSKKLHSRKIITIIMIKMEWI